MTAHLLLVNGAKRAYADALTEAGYRVTTVGSMREALTLRRRPDAVIVELVIPGGDLEQIQQFKSGRRTRAMTVIALAEDAHQDDVVKCGATFCRQPCPPDELVGFVRRTLALRPPPKRARGQRSSRRV